MPGKKRSKGTKDVFVAPITGRPAVQKYTKHEEWLPYKTKIIELLREDRSHAEISSILKSEYNFSITIEQLKTRLNIWGIRRNFTKAQKWFILNEIDKRGSKLLFRYEDQAKGSYINPDRINRVIAHRSREEEGTWLESSNAANPVGLIACSPPLQNDVADKRSTNEMMLDETILDGTIVDQTIVDQTIVDQTIVDFDTEYRPDINSENIEDIVVDRGTRAVREEIHPPVDNPPSTCTNVITAGSCINDEDTEQQVMPLDMAENRQFDMAGSEDEQNDEDIKSITNQVLQNLRITSDYGINTAVMTLDECMTTNDKNKATLAEQLGRRARAVITKVLMKYFGLDISKMSCELQKDLLFITNDGLVTLGEEIDIHLELPTLRVLIAKRRNNQPPLKNFSRLLDAYNYSRQARWYFDHLEYGTALDLCSKAYSAFCQNLGPYHLRTLESLYHQGSCLRSQYQLKKASEFFFEAATRLEVAQPRNVLFRQKAYRAYVDCSFSAGEVWNAWLGTWKSLLGRIDANMFRTKRYEGDLLQRTEMVRSISDIFSNLYSNTDPHLASIISEASWMLCRRRYGNENRRTQGARLAFICSLLRIGRFPTFRKQLRLMKKSPSYYFNHDFVRLLSLRAMDVVWNGGTYKEAEMELLDLLVEIETSRGSFPPQFIFHQQIQFDVLRILSNLTLNYGNNLNKSIIYLERSISKATSLFGTSHIDTIMATEKMVEALMKRGLVLYARPLQYYIIEGYETIYDEYHPKVSEKIGALVNINNQCWE